jgi:hypothetical protein
MLVMLMLAGAGNDLSLKPLLHGNADAANPGLKYPQVAPGLKTSLQLPALVRVHAAVLAPGGRAHVAAAGVPPPRHAAEQVAPTVLLKQPAIQTALLIGRLLAVGTPGQVTA